MAGRKSSYSFDKIAERWPTYSVHYLGRAQAKGEAGREYIQEPLELLLRQQKGKKPEKVLVEVSSAGIFMEKARGMFKRKRVHLAIDSITYGVEDSFHGRVFAVITTNNSHKSMYCHAFLCDTKDTAKDMKYWLGRSFRMAYQDLADVNLQDGPDYAWANGDIGAGSMGSVRAPRRGGKAAIIGTQPQQNGIISDKSPYPTPVQPQPQGGERPQPPARAPSTVITHQVPNGRSSPGPQRVRRPAPAPPAAQAVPSNTTPQLAPAEPIYSQVNKAAKTQKPGNTPVATSQTGTQDNSNPSSTKRVTRRTVATQTLFTFFGYPTFTGEAVTTAMPNGDVQPVVNGNSGRTSPHVYRRQPSQQSNGNPVRTSPNAYRRMPPAPQPIINGSSGRSSPNAYRRTPPAPQLNGSQGRTSPNLYKRAPPSPQLGTPNANNYPRARTASQNESGFRPIARKVNRQRSNSYDNIVYLPASGSNFSVPNVQPNNQQIPQTANHVPSAQDGVQVTNGSRAAPSFRQEEEPPLHNPKFSITGVTTIKREEEQRAEKNSNNTAPAQTKGLTVPQYDKRNSLADSESGYECINFGVPKAPGADDVDVTTNSNGRPTVNVGAVSYEIPKVAPPPLPARNSTKSADRNTVNGIKPLKSALKKPSTSRDDQDVQEKQLVIVEDKAKRKGLLGGTLPKSFRVTFSDTEAKSVVFDERL
ncbi:cuticle collagen bli-1-like [Branchiostoma floridae]|uniref:Cuticle collagen bli-1-like n=2 Tax=Branchiostoma floridae TaxID=7739 RepID=A0A9J7N6E4_BRAFL|nr:cuticle collagen bli-1-like [Branchiostoma floridae]